MATVETNERRWDEYAWPRKGDEWSRRAGGPDLHWWGMLYPRLREFLPAGTILEIAPGHGRFTRYLVDLCDRFIGVDLVESCVEACRREFADRGHAKFAKNDGLTLPMVPDWEVDFAISFDSLVHCESDVVESYVRELALKLSADGVAFIHHSNLADCRDPETGELPEGSSRGRGKSMSARLFEQLCQEAGLLCIGQELIRWREQEDWFRDSFSLLTRPGSRFARGNRVMENPDYPQQLAWLVKIGELYGPGGFPQLTGPAGGGPAAAQRPR